MFATFKSKLLALIVTILSITSLSFMMITAKGMKRNMLNAAEKSAKDELHLVMLNIDNQYKNLSYHRIYAREKYKSQLKNLVSIVEDHIDTFHQMEIDGKVSGKRAREMALEKLQNFRYGNNDYFYIYDKNFIAVSHPDPAIMGTDMSNFRDVKGTYVVRAFPQIVAKTGDGYFSHWHIRLGETQPAEKLSYIRFYKPWGWYIGTGVYIDDIEHDAQEKMKDILEQLRSDFARITIGQTGYFFLFTGKGIMLIHPTMAGQNVFGFKHPITHTDHFKVMMGAANHPDEPYRYYWDKPSDQGNFKYLKESYMRHFVPLDWYIGSTVYMDELNEAARKIIIKQTLVMVLILLFSLALAYLLVNWISRPLKQLTFYTNSVVSHEFTASSEIQTGVGRLAKSFKDEVGKLAGAIGHMIQALSDYVQKLTETTAIRERMQSELRIAHDIQMSMIPKKFPPFPEKQEFDIHAALEPAKDVGGDFYDFFLIDNQHLFIAIGDVSDKGVPAALFMARSKTLEHAITTSLRIIGEINIAPHEILNRVNEELVQGNDLCMFVTLFCGIVNLENGQFQYSNGGHNPPFLMTADGEIKFLEKTGGMPLGIRKSSHYSTRMVMLQPGDALFLYTDGITEAQNMQGMFYNENNLEKYLAQLQHSTPREMAYSILDEIKRYRGAAPQSDDISLVAFRYYGLKEAVSEAAVPSLVLSIRNDVSELERLRESLENFWNSKSLPLDILFDVNLIVEEVVVNIISYAFENNGLRPITIEFYLQNHDLLIRVEDNGRPFNPLEQASLSKVDGSGKKREQGRGIHLLRKLSNRLDYQRSGDKNILTIQKSLLAGERSK